MPDTAEPLNRAVAPSYADLGAIQSAAMRRLIPPPGLDLGEFMEEHMRLPASASALPGPIRLHKWQRGVASAISDPIIRRVSVQKSARVGYTTLLLGALGDTIANRPAPTLLILPVLDDCRAFMVDFLEPVCAASPILRNALSDDQDEAGRNTLLGKRFPNGSLALIPARSPRALRARTAKNVFFDEVDAMEVTAEGDPISLGIMRSQTFAQRKIIMGGTPVFEESSRIIRAYDEGDGRVFECVPPCCGVPTEIEWSMIEWPEGEPDKAAFRCPHCGELVAERFKPQMVEAGEWRITRPHVQGHASFRVNSLISLTPNTSWADIAADFLVKKRAPDTLQTWVNLTLGQPWRSDGESIDMNELQARAEPFGLHAIPESVRIITAGLDVQRDRLEMTFLGFSESETFVLGHDVVWGDPKEHTTWAEADDKLKARWKHPLGAMIGVDSVCCDAGDGETQQYVMAFANPRFGARRVAATKGVAGFSRAIITASHTKGSRLFIVGVDSIKARIMTQLSRGKSWRFSNTLSADWFEQFTSEKLEIRYSHGAPTRRFVPIMGRRQEAKDCVVYAIAARNLVNLDLTRRENELRGLETAPAMKTVHRSKWMQGHRE